MNHHLSLQQLADDLDAAAQRAPVPPSDIKAPAYGAPQRDAINSVVDNIVSDLCGKIGELRRTLDAIEQQILEGAAGAKAALQSQIAVCVRFNEELAHMQGAVEQIKATAALK